MRFICLQDLKLAQGCHIGRHLQAGGHQWPETNHQDIDQRDGGDDDGRGEDDCTPMEGHRSVWEGLLGMESMESQC